MQYTWASATDPIVQSDSWTPTPGLPQIGLDVSTAYIGGLVDGSRPSPGLSRYTMCSAGRSRPVGRWRRSLPPGSSSARPLRGPPGFRELLRNLIQWVYRMAPAFRSRSAVRASHEWGRSATETPLVDNLPAFVDARAPVDPREGGRGACAHLARLGWGGGIVVGTLKMMLKSGTECLSSPARNCLLPEMPARAGCRRCGALGRGSRGARSHSEPSLRGELRLSRRQSPAGARRATRTAVWEGGASRIAFGHRYSGSCATVPLGVALPTPR